LRTACSSRSDVGRVVDVGLHHGGVGPQPAGPQHPVGGQPGHQRGVELPDDLGAGATDQLDQRGRMRHRPVQADAAAPPPRQRVGDLSTPALVAEPVPVFQVQQPQQRIDRDRRATKPSAEQGPPRRQEPVVVQVGVDLGQLGGQPLGSSGSNASHNLAWGSVSRSTAHLQHLEVTTVSFNHKPNTGHWCLPCS
jgi:hypothetical protein